jgi:hypothetical protein
MLRSDAVPEPVRRLLLRLEPLPLLRGFALGGGTSLALRLGHRLSVDLDFFTTEPFSPQLLLEGLELEATVMGIAPNSLTMDAGGVKVDLLGHAYPVLEPPEIIDGVCLISLPDVTAMKLKAIANRGSKKDFFDFVELLDHCEAPAMLDWFCRKYRSNDPFTVIRSLAWFEDAESEPDTVSMKGVTWDDVKKQVTAAVARL